MIAALLLTLAPWASSSAIALQQTPPAESSKSKIDGALAAHLLTTAADQLVPVDVVLSAQVSKQDIDAASLISSKTSRRTTVVTMLRDLAGATQGDLVRYLESRQASGAVGPRIDRLWIANVVSAHVTADVVQQLAKRQDVGSIHYDPPRGEEVLAAIPAVDGGADAPTCGLNLIGAPQAWSSLGVTGRGVVVGMIDTGVCPTHPDMAGQRWINAGEIPSNGIDDDGNTFIDDLSGWNFESNNNSTTDTAGHGSHTAGTVAGDGTAGTACGVAPDARIMVLKFWNSFSGEQSVWNGMQYGVANGADVISASIGWPHSANPNRAVWRQVCENTIAAGLVVIYAAGNEGRGSLVDNVRTPGDVPSVITVGAVDCGNNIASFSSVGPVSWTGIAPYNDHPFPPGLIKPDVSAPGVSTTSHSFCASYTNLDGTSMATPHVAGLAALLLEADPTLDHFGVKAILEATALDLGSVGKDNSYGAGRIRAVQAVQSALSNGNYCSAKLNSCGTVPMITASGTPSATATSGFTVSASNTSGGQIGLLIYSEAGSAQIPFLGGFLCINGVRRSVPVSDTVGTSGQCNGVLTIDMNAFRAGLLGGNPHFSLFVPGTLITTQYWARDTANPFGCLLTAAFPYVVGP